MTTDQTPSPLGISAAGLHLIASFEGFLPSWYKDVGGVPTIGYGHTGPLPAGVSSPITVAQGIGLLRSDAQVAVDAVNRAIDNGHPFPWLGIEKERATARFQALVSLAFNIGTGAFALSSLVAAINQARAPRDWHEVSPLWLEWDHVGGAVVQGLLNRRREELAIFIPGRFPTA